MHRVRMDSLCVVVRENAGELVDSARLSWAAKCGEAAVSVVRGVSAGPLVWLSRGCVMSRPCSFDIVIL